MFVLIVKLNHMYIPAGYRSESCRKVMTCIHNELVCWSIPDVYNTDFIVMYFMLWLFLPIMFRRHGNSLITFHRIFK